MLQAVERRENVDFQTRPWLTLITYCTMAGLAAGLALALLFTTASLAFAGEQSAPSEEQSATAASVASPAKTFSGMITDSRCGAKHKSPDKNPEECARACVRNGATYKLVDGDKSYDLRGDEKDLARKAGQRVTVAGTLSGTSIEVRSVNN
jgi:hypothetical protein